MSDLAFEARGLEVRYPGARRAALDGVDLRVPRGRFCAVLGPNGSGKSTLIRALLGVIPLVRGTVLLDGRPLAAWRREEVARRVGVVPQSEEIVFPLSVRELVAMGRYPHLGPWRPPRAEDRSAVQRALETCDVAHLADRRVATLSGGEHQGARIARALAQAPASLALDEPTTSLDIRHEMAIFELLARLCASDGVTVLLVTHNLNLAARYADELVLLDDGRVAASGAPGSVLVRDVVERVYRWPVMLVPHAGPGRGHGAPQVVPLAGGPHA